MADFPLSMGEAFLGTLDNPALSQAYRKAIVRQAPASFTASVHPPRKQGSNYHYGMRIIPSLSSPPTSPTKSAPSSPRSGKSGASKEYDIFRRWEDCLEFQHCLEVEYAIIAHRRKNGHPALNHRNKNTLYPTQRAASFDSLPLGPDPSSIAADVHGYIPKLNKRTILFRANQATINQRGEEFKAMIEALLDPDAHSTIQELQTVPLVRDFFGLWRRDKEAERRSLLKVNPAPMSPPPALLSQPPATAPGVMVPVRSQGINHLANFAHVPGSPSLASNASKGSKPLLTSPRGRPSTASADGHVLNKRAHATLLTSPSATELGYGSGSGSEQNQNHGSPANARLPVPHGFTRGHTLPAPDHMTGGSPIQKSDMGPQSREPILLRSVAKDQRPPPRKGSAPDFTRPPSLDRTNMQDISPIPSLLGTAVDPAETYDPFSPMPMYHPMQTRNTSQPGRSRKATLRDPNDESIDKVTPVKSFPFDDPPDSPVSPGLAGIGLMKSNGMQGLASLATLDPELYKSLSAQQARAAPWTVTQSPDIDEDDVRMIPRARRTPPIQTNGNRSARFFVSDPSNNMGIVDVASGPPPRSPLSAPSTVRPDQEHFPESRSINNQYNGQVSNINYSKPIAVAHGKPTLHPPKAYEEQRPGTAGSVYSLYRTMSDYGKPNRGSATSGTTAPTLSSSFSMGSSWSSQVSPQSPKGAQPPRRQSRASMGSIAEQRRLSLDSLVLGDYDPIYNANRNLSTPQFPHKNMSSDAVFLAVEALSEPPSSSTPRPRGSYSSLDSTSTGLEDTSGARSSGSSLHAHAAAKLVPSKAPITLPKSNPPPRPPRSALRNSAHFSTSQMGTLADALKSGRPPPTPPTEHPPFPLVNPPKTNSSDSASRHETHDFIDSYFLSSPTPSPSQELPVPIPVGHRVQESNVSGVTNFVSYYQHDNHQSAQFSELGSSVASLPPTPFSATFDSTPSPTHAGGFLNSMPSSSQSAFASIKAIHIESDTIVAFKVPRSNTTLADLRAKIARKIFESGSIELHDFSLKYAAARGDHPSTPPNKGGRKRSLSVTSTSDINSLHNLDNENDWRKALNIDTKIIIRII